MALWGMVRSTGMAIGHLSESVGTVHLWILMGYEIWHKHVGYSLCDAYDIVNRDIIYFIIIFVAYIKTK